MYSLTFRVCIMLP